MRPKTCLIIGLVSTILALISLFLPWYTAGSVHIPVWYFFVKLIFESTGTGWLIALVMLILAFVGENLGLIGSVTIGQQRRLLYPIMLLLGGLLSLLSTIVFAIVIVSIFELPLIGQYESPAQLFFLSVGFWLELVASILMLIAGTLTFVSVRRKPIEAMMPPTSITPPTPPPPDAM